MKKKISLTISLFAVAFAFGAVLKTHAAPNTTGWLWGGGDDGGSPAISSGLNSTSMNNTTSGDATSYGVTIPYNAGAGNPVAGYAWNENLGWIDFNPHAGCPGTPKYSHACDAYPSALIPAQDVMTANGSPMPLIGWARFVGVAQEEGNITYSPLGNAGGNDGWIMFGGNPGGTNNVTIDPVTYKLSGYAWSGDMGYIDMSGATTTNTCTASTYTYSPTVTDNCSSAGCGAAGTSTCTCSKTDNCGFTSGALQSDCGVACTTTAITCPPCPSLQKGIWKEVAP